MSESYSSVVPLLGVLTANMITWSPWPAAQRCLRSPSLLQHHSTLVYPLMMVNALAWLVYALLLGNTYIFWANICGWLLGFYLTLQFYALSSMPSSPNGLTAGASPDHGKWLMGLAVGGQAWVMLGAYWSFLVYKPLSSASTLWMGWTAIGALLLFYAAPLSALSAVLRRRDASSFQWPLMVTCLANAVLWSAYGWSLSDPFIYGPNLFGLVMVFIQMGFKLVYPSLGSL